MKLIESEINFSEGIQEEPVNCKPMRIAELIKKLSGKHCKDCERFEERDGHCISKKNGYHCTMQSYDIDIDPDDEPCVEFWDAEQEERIKKAHEEAIENRRKELWSIYQVKEPIKLPIVRDLYGCMIPMCPICGEMPYSTEQCHWCGQKFIQDKELEEYNTPVTKE